MSYLWLRPEGTQPPVRPELSYFAVPDCKGGSPTKSLFTEDCAQLKLGNSNIKGKRRKLGGKLVFSATVICSLENFFNSAYFILQNSHPKDEPENRLSQ